MPYGIYIAVVLGLAPADKIPLNIIKGEKLKYEKNTKSVSFTIHYFNIRMLQIYTMQV